MDFKYRFQVGHLYVVPNSGLLSVVSRGDLYECVKRKEGLFSTKVSFINRGSIEYYEYFGRFSHETQENVRDKV